MSALSTKMKTMPRTLPVHKSTADEASSGTGKVHSTALFSTTGNIGIMHAPDARTKSETMTVSKIKKNE